MPPEASCAETREDCQSLRPKAAPIASMVARPSQRVPSLRHQALLWDHDLANTENLSYGEKLYNSGRLWPAEVFFHDDGKSAQETLGGEKLSDTNEHRQTRTLEAERIPD